MESNTVYMAPEVVVLRIRIEKGFANSSSEDYTTDVGDYWQETDNESEDY